MATPQQLRAEWIAGMTPRQKKAFVGIEAMTGPEILAMVAAFMEHPGPYEWPTEQAGSREQLAQNHPYYLGQLAETPRNYELFGFIEGFQFASEPTLEHTGERWLKHVEGTLKAAREPGVGPMFWVGVAVVAVFLFAPGLYLDPLTTPRAVDK